MSLLKLTKRNCQSSKPWPHAHVYIKTQEVAAIEMTQGEGTIVHLCGGTTIMVAEHITEVKSALAADKNTEWELYDDPEGH